MDAILSDRALLTIGCHHPTPGGRPVEQAHSPRGWTLSEVASKELLRIVQEALANVRRHAAARSVRVRLWRDGALPDGTPVRHAVHAIAMPGLGTGVGGLSPEVCAQRVGEALDEILGEA